MKVEYNVNEVTTLLGQEIIGIDHIAIAVLDLNQAIQFYSNLLGFRLIERRETYGNDSGMISAVLEQNNLTFVLLQGTNEYSQISQYIKHYGPGVQHLAISVRSLNNCVDILNKTGFSFETSIIEDESLKQIFSIRDTNTGMMLELIERVPGAQRSFSSKNVQQLFEQLEEKETF